MTEGANNAPPARSCSDGHRQSAESNDPDGQDEGRSPEKSQETGQVVEASRFGAGEKCKGNDTHGLLRVI